MLRSWIGLAVIAAVGVFGLGLAGAQAATVSGTYSGHVTSLDPQMAGQFALGDPFTVDFTYITDTATDSVPANPNLGIYQAVFTSITGTIGGYNFALATGGPIDSVRVDNDSLGRDLLIFDADVAGSPVNGFDPYGLEVFLQDDTHALFSGDALPTSALPAALFSSGSMQLNLVAGTVDAPLFSFVRATIDIPTPTPIPPTLGLFVSALCGLSWFGWRRRTSPAVQQAS
jgi:hypothetical protein